ncbi:hypothetical protein DFH94DRAFT_775864 [Russula ochroleuca]|uniref:Secreted protein n=1 Tax=Russula ochroleuca TaxID=152965 RepID=A0A9P5JX96_9AGAM|nr:hypothetical protein DFH94DRAFT_775864 [Russula ochroleuca]
MNTFRIVVSYSLLCTICVVISQERSNYSDLRSGRENSVMPVRQTKMVLSSERARLDFLERWAFQASTHRAPVCSLSAKALRIETGQRRFV